MPYKYGKGKVTYRKGSKPGCYDVCVGGMPKRKSVKGVVKARLEANRLRKLQGKKAVKKAVKKLLKN